MNLYTINDLSIILFVSNFLQKDCWNAQYCGKSPWKIPKNDNRGANKLKLNWAKLSYLKHLFRITIQIDFVKRMKNFNVTSSSWTFADNKLIRVRFDITHCLESVALFALLHFTLELNSSTQHTSLTIQAKQIYMPTTNRRSTNETKALQIKTKVAIKKNKKKISSTRISLFKINNIHINKLHIL